VWRLRGELESEEKYITRLHSLSEDILGTAMETDLRYFRARKKHLQ
jgi:hypothetical protein